VTTTLSRYDGAIHGFIRMAGTIDLADAALDEVAAWLKSLSEENRG
jgi:hypothetical protein